MSDTGSEVEGTETESEEEVEGTGETDESGREEGEKGYSAPPAETEGGETGDDEGAA